MFHFDEVFGGVSVVIILGVYALVSLGVLPATSWLFYVLNAIGSSGLAFIAFKKKATQPAVLNIIWILIALVGMGGLLL